MSAILLEGGIVHYEVIGRGRPIIFLHGWVGSWRYWIPAMQAASTVFRAYALDLWGFGDSAHDPERYPVTQQITLLENFLGEMGIGKVALIGHGLGGLIGLHFAHRNPQMVDRILSVNVPLDLSLVNARLRGSLPSDLADWLLAKDPSADPARMDVHKADSQAVSASFANSESFSLANRLSTLTNPCLLVYGQNDPAITAPVYTPENSPYNLHLISLEQTGHYPMLEDTARFNRLLTDFLALDSGVSPRELQLKEEWKRRVR